MLTVYERLAAWAVGHIAMLVVLAVAGLPGAFLVSLALNAYFGEGHPSFAWIFLWSLPFGIWATGALLTTVYYGPRARVCQRWGSLVRGVAAAALTIWMLSPIALFLVLLS